MTPLTLLVPLPHSRAQQSNGGHSRLKELCSPSSPGGVLWGELVQILDNTCDGEVAVEECRPKATKVSWVVSHTTGNTFLSPPV